jgi:hypothetical protein
VVLIALVRKLLVIANAVIRTGVPGAFPSLPMASFGALPSLSMASFGALPSLPTASFGAIGFVRRGGKSLRLARLASFGAAENRFVRRQARLLGFVRRLPSLPLASSENVPQPPWKLAFW